MPNQVNEIRALQAEAFGLLRKGQEESREDIIRLHARIDTVVHQLAEDREKWNTKFAEAAADRAELRRLLTDGAAVDRTRREMREASGKLKDRWVQIIVAVSTFVSLVLAVIALFKH